MIKIILKKICIVLLILGSPTTLQNKDFLADIVIA